ncbi:MAG: DUF2784 domain-containing protein [Deltaproteobacteria bacterium]|nr:MAG: DUF2784 domain-containing protein [Deltaproteobacteria bacterium]
MSTAQPPYHLYHWLADLVVLLHVAFVVFAVFGGLLAVRWRRAMWIHLTAVAWAVIVEFFGWICPLTPLENWLRWSAGEAGYRSDFIAHYVLPVLYPEGLTREMQIALGLLVIAVNLAIYGWIFRSNRRIKDC